MTPSVSRWVASWPYPFTVEMAEDRVGDASELNAAGKALLLAIERREDEALLGCIGVQREGHDPWRGGLGYWIGEPYQGQGYATEAAVGILGPAFRLLDLEVIEACAQPENEASFAIMRRLGMKPAGERMVFAPARQREELCLVYEIVRPA